VDDLLALVFLAHARELSLKGEGSGKGGSQQILTDFSRLWIRVLDWLSQLASNGRICWLTFAALRMPEVSQLTNGSD
jgi:hypothetical protein